MVCGFFSKGEMQSEKGSRRYGSPFSKDCMNGVDPPSSSSLSLSPLGANSIEHRVSKMDTLAGIAIKYGVEVADVRRMNGLVTDLQMFAHKSLQIPLPGRHPPSPILSNGSTINGEHTPPRPPLNEVLDSFGSLKLKSRQAKVSQAMSNLHGYYGLTPPKRGPRTEGTEMAVYRVGGALLSGDELMPRVSPASIRHHRKSTSLVNGFFQENGDNTDMTDVSEVEVDRSIRRRQKTELLLKEDAIGGFSTRAGKSLAPRPKSGSRTDIDMARVNANPIGDSFIADGLAAVRKSSSTSNLQESDGGGSSIRSSSKWSLKPDGFPMPMTIRWNKAALD